MTEEPEVAPSQVQVQMQQLQDKVNHYTKLLNLSKQALQLKEKQLQEKDAVVEALRRKDMELQEKDRLLDALRVDLEEARKSGRGAKEQLSSHGAAQALVPFQAMCQVQQEGVIWVLFEFEDQTEEWRRFESEEGLQDFVRRDHGEPIRIPEPCMDEQEATQLRKDMEQSVGRITEEFRRFRVRAEISRKQKDAEARQAAAASIVGHQRRINGQDLEGELQKAKAEVAQVNSLLEELKDQEDKWRSTCDELARENEQLRSQGSEAALAAQWRQRYEQAVREKEELAAKLRMGDAAQGVEGNSSDAQKYQALREEYKMYRKKAMEAIKEKDMLLAEATSAAQSEGLRRDARGALNGSAAFGQAAIEDPRLQYLKNLMLKYLSTDEFEAKEHMERAIMTVLQFSGAEQAYVQERRTDGTVAWLSNWLQSTPASPSFSMATS